MIYTTIVWFKTVKYRDKSPVTVANIPGQKMLTRYPVSRLVCYYKGNFFIGKISELIDTV